MPTKAEREGWMPTRGSTRIERNIGGGLSPKIDLDHLEVHKLVSELSTKFNRNNDVGVIRSFFRRRRIEAHDRHLSSLMDLVNNVRRHADNLLEFKTQLMSQKQVLYNRIVKVIEESQFAVDRQREEHDTFVSQQISQRELANLDVAQAQKKVELVQAEIELLQAQALRERAEAFKLHGEAGIIDKQGELLDTVRQQVDFKNMPPILQAIVMIKAINPMANIDVDTVLKDKVLAEQLKKMAADTEHMNARAAQERVKAEYEKWKMKQETMGSDV